VDSQKLLNLGRLQPFTANIKLAMTNALAYYGTELVASVKSFIVQAAWFSSFNR